MRSTPSAILTVTRFLQYWNALTPIFLIVPGTLILVMLLLFSNIPDWIATMV